MDLCDDSHALRNANSLTTSFCGCTGGGGLFDRGSNACDSSYSSWLSTPSLPKILAFEVIESAPNAAGNFPPDSMRSRIASKRLSFRPTLRATRVIEGRNNRYSFPNGFSRAINASTAYFRRTASSLSKMRASGATIALACWDDAHCMRGKSLDNEAKTARRT